MNLTFVKKIPTAEEIIQEAPLSEKGHQQVVKDRQEIQDILSGKDDRLLIIAGPCSAWPYDAVIDYAQRLKKVSDELQDKLKLVVRTYIQKPRTTKGWTGPVNQPDLFLPPDISEGAKYSRRLMVEIIEAGLPIADEALFTHNAKGFIELLSWVAIGARSAEDQEHRIFASAIECPVGMKNPTSGSISIGVNSVVAAQYPHIAVFNGDQVETHGNKHAHLVLRGGSSMPNYSSDNILKAKRLMKEHEIDNPAIIVDASHDNCKVNGEKMFENQAQVIRDIMEMREQDPEVKEIVKGFMIESFIKPGNQKVSGKKPEEIDMDGLSITDPCLGWEKTEELLRELTK